MAGELFSISNGGDWRAAAVTSCQEIHNQS